MKNPHRNYPFSQLMSPKNPVFLKHADKSDFGVRLFTVSCFQCKVTGLPHSVLGLEDTNPHF